MLPKLAIVQYLWTAKSLLSLQIRENKIWKKKLKKQHKLKCTWPSSSFFCQLLQHKYPTDIEGT